MLWKYIEEGIIMPVGVLGIWLNTIGTGSKEKEWQKEGD